MWESKIRILDQYVVFCDNVLDQIFLQLFLFCNVLWGLHRSFSSAGAIEGAVSIASGRPAVSVSNQQIMDCSGVDCLNAKDGTMTKVGGW